jgi:hypothetical protein
MPGAVSFRPTMNFGNRIEIAAKVRIRNDTNPLTQWLTPQNPRRDGIFGLECPRNRSERRFSLAAPGLR